MWIKEFSNFYLPADMCIVHENIAYPSVEHFFVAMKSLDVSVRLEVARIGHPAEAKEFGNSIKLRPDWSHVRRSVMLFALRQKFEHKHMKQALLDSGHQNIVHEVHWHDNFWASCVCPSCVDAEKHNLLGVCLMKVRAELIENNNVDLYLQDWHEEYYGTPCKVIA